MQTAQIIAFKDLLRARFPQAHAVRLAAPALSTGVACLDLAGIMVGSICEIVSAHVSSGAGLLRVALLSGEKESTRQPAALVDGADAFDPASVPKEALEQLLWVRCHDVERAMQAVDPLLRDGNIPRVLLDLQWCAPREVRQVPAPVWHRLRMLAEKSGAALCAFTPFQTVPCAKSRLVLEEAQALEAMDTSREVLQASLKGRVVRRSSAVDPVIATTTTLAAAG